VRLKTLGAWVSSIISFCFNPAAKRQLWSEMIVCILEVHEDSENYFGTAGALQVLSTNNPAPFITDY
jgi:hypothetical protein